MPQLRHPLARVKRTPLAVTPHTFRASGIILLTWCLGGLGCGSGTPPTGLVSGKVTLQEKPIEQGYVTFNSSAKGVAAGANLNAAGEFQLTDPLPLGEYVVTVTPPAATSPLLAAPGVQRVTSTIPEKYRSEAKSDLRFQMKAGANKAKFDLLP